MNQACVALALYGSTDVDIEELPFIAVVPALVAVLPVDVRTTAREALDLDLTVQICVIVRTVQTAVDLSRPRVKIMCWSVRKWSGSTGAVCTELPHVGRSGVLHAVWFFQ